MAVGANSLDSCFLQVKTGDFVVIGEGASVLGSDDSSWWLGRVLHVVGGARDPDSNSIFQVVDVDTGCIKTINADLVKGILASADLDNQ